MKPTAINMRAAAVAWMVSFAVTSLFAQGFRGSAHDFSSEPFSGGRVCTTCHTAKAVWNHESSEAVYAISDSPTIDAPDFGQPNGASAKCLSCHDGTVPIDAFGGWPGSFFILPEVQVGPDLRGHHPVSFTYDTALSVVDGALNDPATTASGLGGTIAGDLLSDDGTLECNSCHDQHAQNDNPRWLVKPLEGAALCNTCHNLGDATRGHHIPGRSDPWNNCVLCHGVDLVGNLGPSCMGCHNDFLLPDLPTRGHNLAAGHTNFDIDDRLAPFDEGCIFCHGDDLQGGIGPSCFTCHGPLWLDDGGLTDPATTTIEISAPPARNPAEEAGSWLVSVPLFMTELSVTLEAFDGILLVETRPPEGPPSFGIGAEFEGAIFWMDVSGVLFFGNVDHDAGTMRGIVFGYGGSGAIWFAEKQ